MAVDRIRIRLKAYDHMALDKSVDEIVQTVKRSGARIAGPVPLPTARNHIHGAAIPTRGQEIARAV